MLSSRSGLWIVVKCSEVGLLGERGSKVPSASIGELALEVELSLAMEFEFSRCARPPSYCLQGSLLQGAGLHQPVLPVALPILCCAWF